MTFETTLSQMQNIHQTIKTNDEGIPTYPLSSNYHLRITGVDTDDWDVWSPMSKRIFKQDAKGIPEQINKDIVDIADEWNEIVHRGVAGELCAILKTIGFEPPAEDVKEVLDEEPLETDEARKQTKIDAKIKELERRLFEKQEAESKKADVIETPVPPEIKVPAKNEYTKPGEVKKTHTKKAKHNSTAKTEEYPDRFGIELPIAYPPELKGQLMKFMQWKKVNNVLTTESEVLVLDEDEYNFMVNIPSAHLGFTINRSKVEIINPAPEKAV